MHNVPRAQTVMKAAESYSSLHLTEKETGPRMSYIHSAKMGNDGLFPVASLIFDAARESSTEQRRPCTA